jgi:hypothetical protein
MRGDELARWRLEQATNVVRGRVVEIHADEKIVRKTWGTVAVAKLKVGSVIKGNVPGKVLTLVTASGGSGSCSLASVLLNTVGSRDDVILSVGNATTFGNKQEYVVTSCGYFAYAPRMLR